MKKSLQEKLKKYGTMAAAVTGAVASADAQVVYTDLIPDSVFNNDGDTFHLDLNNDAIIDFQINLSKSHSSGGSWSNTTNRLLLGAAVGNQFLRDGSGPLALSFGAPINSAAATWASGNASNMAYYYRSWSSYTTTTTSYTNNQTYTSTFTTSWTTSSSSGNWLNATDKYLGLKFQILGQTHYGWARLDVSSSVNGFTVKDYAYESTPNTQITAGDVGVITSISQLNLIEDVQAFVTNQDLNLRVSDEQVGYQFKLVDMLGRDVINETIGSTSSKYDVSNYPKGVYIVLIEGEEKAYSNKVIIR